MANKWLVHVKKTMKQMKSRGQYKKGDGLKKVILAAKKTYSKGKKGGAESESDEEMDADPAAHAAEGARRRGRKTARKTRRLRK
jgi:multimeric flavodoxin WrbA